MLARLDWPAATLEFGQDSDEARRVEAQQRRAIELAPGDPDLYVTMAGIAENTRRYEEALDWLEKGLAIDPLSARLHLEQGRLRLRRLRRPEEAAQSFAVAHEILPEWPAAMIFAGDAALAMGKVADGVEWYLHSMSLDPQDHELPSEIASLYYQLGLLEEGDAMLQQAQALAPREILTRSVQLERYLLADNYERAVAYAAEIIRDRIENRGGAFDLAVSGYVSSMIELGQAGQVADFFETVQPGISDLAYEPRGSLDSSLQFFLTMALLETGAFEAAEVKMSKVVELADRVVPEWRQYHDTMAVVAMAEGDREAAVSHALADMSQAVGRRLHWNINYRHTAWMKPLLRDPRIARRIEELDGMVRDAAAEVREMLASRQEDAAPPP